MERPFSQACENNKAAILNVIKPLLKHSGKVLEIGSGTGQHAVYFAEEMPQLFWQTSDCRENIAGINHWLDWAGLENIGRPVELDVNNRWSVATVPALFSANTLHIMSWQEVERFFLQLAAVVADNGLVCVYGPFNYGGQYTSESNASFDRWLKTQNPCSAIRDFERVDALANEAGLVLETDYSMPANNRLLHWQKRRPEAA